MRIQQNDWYLKNVSTHRHKISTMKIERISVFLEYLCRFFCVLMVVLSLIFDFRKIVQYINLAWKLNTCISVMIWKKSVAIICIYFYLVIKYTNIQRQNFEEVRMVIADEYTNFTLLFWRYVPREVRRGKFEKASNSTGKMEREEKSIYLFWLLQYICLCSNFKQTE